jgi:hypothetical protein
MGRFLLTRQEIEHSSCQEEPSSNECRDERSQRQADRAREATTGHASSTESRLPQGDDSNEHYPFRDLDPRIRALVDAFGPQRTFWGTALTRMPCYYYECITLFTEHLPWLQGEDLEWVMGRGVCEWLGWPLPKERPE